MLICTLILYSLYSHYIVQTQNDNNITLQNTCHLSILDSCQTLKHITYSHKSQIIPKFPKQMNAIHNRNPKSSPGHNVSYMRFLVVGLPILSWAISFCMEYPVQQTQACSWLKYSQSLLCPRAKVLYWCQRLPETWWLKHMADCRHHLF